MQVDGRKKTTTEIRDFHDFRLSGVEVGKDYSSYTPLVAREFETTRIPSFYDYRSMLKACRAAASPTLKQLSSQDYKVWLLLETTS